MMITSNNFAANRITKSLQEKIRSGLVQGKNAKVNIYVSAEGSDSTGDGTQAKPYKTINHVLVFVVPYINCTYGIRINALTPLECDQTAFQGRNSILEFKGTSADAMITFIGALSVQKGSFQFSHCIFNKGVDIYQHGFAEIVDSEIKQSKSTEYMLRVRYASSANVYRTNFTSALEKIKSCISVNTFSSMVLSSGDFTISGNFDDLIKLNNQSDALVSCISNVLGSPTGKAYNVTLGSSLNLCGEGVSALPSTLTEGTIDSSSFIC